MCEINVIVEFETGEKEKTNDNNIAWESPIKVEIPEPEEHVTKPKKVYEWNHVVTADDDDILLELKELPAWEDCYSDKYYEDDEEHYNLLYLEDDDYEVVVSEYGAIVTYCTNEKIKSNLGKFVLPSSFKGIPVVAIQEGFFKNFMTSEIVLPDTVYGILTSNWRNKEYIEACWYGRLGAINVRKITVGKSFQLHDEVFYDCRKLKTIEGLDYDNIKKIGYETFKNCVNLDMDLRFPNLLFIGMGAFCECSKIKMHLPEELLQFGWNSFERVPYENIEIPSKLAEKMARSLVSKYMAIDLSISEPFLELD